MEEQYLLRWHCHESTLTKNLPALLDSNVLTDCAVAAGSKTYKAHKVILAACSPYFLDIFQASFLICFVDLILRLNYTNIGPLESSIIVLHDVNSEDIEAILSYIYRGQCLVTKQQIPRLVHLSRALKIQGLCNMKVQDSNENSVDDFLESNFTNDECEIENAENNDAIIVEESPKVSSPPQISRESKQTHSSTNAVQINNEAAAKKTLKDAPEICKCFICGKYLSNQYNLRVHMETHKDTYYSCLSCPHVSKSRDALRKHVSYRHPEEYVSRKRKKNIIP
ncbi:btb domain transcription factor [Holotrichia oblita]|uniref:Btb domain transcription factor n=1 Tax=Holotrichia oblita TaxID=644536 RepID=A0ACB9SV99_HOLOL|nr:btb domain transcription factor [Holotrichia oblita]